jgi:hypothetical protein
VLTAYNVALGKATKLMRHLLRAHRGYECKEPEPGKLTLAFRWGRGALLSQTSLGRRWHCLGAISRAGGFGRNALAPPELSDLELVATAGSWRTPSPGPACCRQSCWRSPGQTQVGCPAC